MMNSSWLPFSPQTTTCPSPPTPPDPPHVKMEMNVTSAQNMLSNPSTEIQKVLDGASDEAKAALGEAKASLNGNDGSTKSGARGGENGETLRVQVVDEEKKFRSVTFLSERARGGEGQGDGGKAQLWAERVLLCS
jgi:hypothetical protein